MKKFALALAAFTALTPVLASAQTAPAQTFNLQVPAGTQNYTDSSGNSYVLDIPSTVVIGTLQFTPASTQPSQPAALANGTYNFTDANNLNLDSGYSATTVGLYNNVNDSCQQWIWNGSQLSNVSVCASNVVLFDNNGAANMGTSSDTFAIVQSGSGYTIEDVTKGQYLESKGASGASEVQFGSSPYVWTATVVANPANLKLPVHK
jgi:hypothetical protein